VPIAELVHPEDANRAHALLASSIASRQGWTGVVVRWRHKDGSYRFLESNAVPVFDDKDTLVGFQGADRDITERRRAEHALRFTQFAVEHAADAVFWIDHEAKFVYVNASACASLGYTKAELLQLSVSDIAPDLPAEMWPMRRQRLVEAGQLVYESRHRTKNGQMFPVELTASWVQFEGESYVCGFARDITTRKQAEQTHRESEEKFRALVEDSPDIIARFDRDCRCLYVNPAVHAALGVAPEALIDRTVEATGQPADRVAWLEAMIRRVFESGQEQTFEFDAMTPKGEDAYLARGVPEFSADGSVVSALLVFRNITDRRRAEQEKERLQSQLIQAQKMEAIGRLAGGIAHDFNNMLTGILGYAELALADLDPAHAAVECLQGTIDVVAQCKALTSQILAFGRKQVLSMAVVDLNEVILSAGKMLRRIIGEDIEMRILPHPELARVRADSAQVLQILLNLAVNARDAMPRGGVLSIATANTVLSEQVVEEVLDIRRGDYALVTVSDTGCGMDSDTLSHVFEPFFTTKQLGRGTGLGLATVYGIVKQHGGHIDVQSTPSTGTMFRIYLPSVEEELCAQAPSAPPAVARGTETVLVVEDDPLVRELTIRHLSACGYAVLSAPGPLEALTLMRQHDGTIAILVTDVVMPVMNGPELYAKVVAERPSLKVLYMSGYAGDTLAAHGGVADLGLCFIQKPFGVAELTRQIRRILDVSP
jgi:PAS domain S-box-containing protein